MQLSVVYKFGGSSVASAERMLEVADIVCSFPEHAPLVVLSAMGKVGTAASRTPGRKLQNDHICNSHVGPYHTSKKGYQLI